MKSLFGVNENQYSSLQKLLRVSVYVLRFVKQRVWNQINVDKQQQFYEHKLFIAIFDNLKQSNPITFQEIKLLSLLWISYIQHGQCPDVYIAIKNNKKDCLQKQLGLKITDFEILRCYGRYLHADLTEEIKYPILLPRYERFTYQDTRSCVSGQESCVTHKCVIYRNR